ncbi:MAG TPA: hypothetical protein VGT61_12240 [Thermomicrobiales bacterium]|jgi:hypothetical protein|nr:hypothetical protein [Thermomicrobiales bacterium]
MTSTTSQQDQSSADLGAAAAEAGQQLQHQVTGVADQVRQQASDQLMTQKERLVDTLDTVALLLRQSGEHAQLQDKALLAQYVDKASGQIGQWSEKLRDQDATQLLEETSNLARRQPLLFAGGALALGFLGARFFRTSAQPAQETPALPATTEASSGEASGNSAASATQTSTASGTNFSSYDAQAPEAGSSLGDVGLMDSDLLDLSTDSLDPADERTLDELTRPEQA